MSEKKETPLTLLAGLLLVFPANFTQAWVLKKMWAWFIVPLGVATIGVSQAYGIVATVSVVLLAQIVNSAKKSDTKLWDLNVTVIVISLIELAFGAIAHSFM